MSTTSSGVDLDSADDAALLKAAGAADRGELDQAPGATTQAIEVQLAPGQDPAEAIEAGLWVGAVVQWGGVVKAMLPEPCSARLDDARLLKIGAAFAKVAKHHGWKFAGLLKNPWAGLAWECFPVAEPVVTPAVMKWLAPAPTATPGDASSSSTPASSSTIAAAGEERAPAPKPPAQKPDGVVSFNVD